MPKEETGLLVMGQSLKSFAELSMTRFDPYKYN